MSVSVEIYERSGAAAGEVELATNANWKSISGDDSLYKYFYYPIRTDIRYLNAYQKVLFGKFSTNALTVRRARWVFSGIQSLTVPNGPMVWFGFSNSYPVPTQDWTQDSICTTPLGNSIIVPNLSTASPEAATGKVYDILPNATYYTNYLVLRLFTPLYGPTIGNWSPTKGTLETGEGEAADFEFPPTWNIKLELDEYE